jgi:hypothetical protein
VVAHHEQSDALRSEQPGDRIRPVGGAIAGDDDLQARSWVVKRHAVAQLRLEVRFLVVGGDEERHAGCDVGLHRLASEQAREDPHQQRVARVDVNQRQQ